MKPWVKATSEGRLYWDKNHPEFKKWFIEQIEKYSKVNLLRPKKESSNSSDNSNNLK